MHPPTRGTAGRLLVVAVASSFFAIAATSPAAAHDGTAVITAESQTIKGTSVDYVVRAVWDNDGHAAADATATVVAESPSGDRVGPVPMEPTDDDGRYTATVDFPSPGDWNVRFTVVTPPGTLEITQTIPAVDAGGATQVVPTPTPESTSTSVAVTADEDASTVDGAESATASQTEERERPTSTAGAALFFFIVAAIILGGCVLAYRSRGQRQAQRPTPTSQPTGATTTTAAATPVKELGAEEVAEPTDRTTDSTESEPDATDNTETNPVDDPGSSDTKGVTAE
jgi:hypothetical protein